jgi:hypothetical protein
MGGELREGLLWAQEQVQALVLEQEQEQEQELVQEPVRELAPEQVLVLVLVRERA